MDDKTTPGQPVGLRPPTHSGARRGMLKSLAGLNLPLQQLTQIQSDYVSKATEVWNASLQRMQPPAAGDAAKPAPIATAASPPPSGRPTRQRHSRRTCICSTRAP